MTTPIVLVIAFAVVFCLGRWLGQVESRERQAHIRHIATLIVQACPPDCPDCAENDADAELDREVAKP